MTFQINQSVINGLPFDFIEEVEKHRLDLLAHRGKLGVPNPYAIHSAVDSAIRLVPGDAEREEDYVADYEIINDIVIPEVREPTLAEKRGAILGRLHDAEAAAVALVISPSRARLMSLDLAAVNAKPEDDRTPEDVAMLDQAKEAADKTAVIIRRFATIAIEVEELTADNIDGWVMPN